MSVTEGGELVYRFTEWSRRILVNITEYFQNGFTDEN